MSRNPTLAEVANDAVQQALDEILISAVAKVLSYDAATQQVDCQVIQKVRHFDELGAPVTLQLPVIPGVPVQFPGGGGYTVTFPIAAGDTVLLVFTALSLDKWLRGASDDPSDPETHARHSLADAVAIPGIKPFSRPRASVPTDHVRIGLDGAAAQGAALGATLDGFLSSLKTYLDTHVHLGVTTGAGVSGVPQVLSTTPPTTESATVKVTE